jgi:hypothetical protein
MGREELDQLENSLSAFISLNSNIPIFQHSSWGKSAELKAV